MTTKNTGKMLRKGQSFKRMKPIIKTLGKGSKLPSQVIWSKYSCFEKLGNFPKTFCNKVCF